MSQSCTEIESIFFLKLTTNEGRGVTTLYMTALMNT